MYHLFRCVIGRRGTALLFFAFLDFVYAYSLFDPAPAVRYSPTALFLAHLAPLWLFGLLWLGVGLVCLGTAFKSRDRWGFAAAMFIKILWAAVFTIGAIDGLDRAYISATIWLCLAGWIAVISTWPEPPTPACDERLHKDQQAG